MIPSQRIWRRRGWSPRQIAACARFGLDVPDWGNASRWGFRQRFLASLAAMARGPGAGRRARARWRGWAA